MEENRNSESRRRGDRRQGDRRTGLDDRRNSNVEKIAPTILAFMVVIIVILIVMCGIIWLVYDNLNTKIEDLSTYNNEYIFDTSYDDDDLHNDSDDESDIVETDSNTNTTEPVTNTNTNQ